MPPRTKTAFPTLQTDSAVKVSVSAPRMMIYQVLPRLYGNTCTTNRPNGTLEENGCGKMDDFTSTRLRRIRSFGFTHIWYTGLLEHATQTDYSSIGIRPDCPEIVKGRAGSPYAIKDYYDIDPDLAVHPARRMEEFNALLERTHRAGLKFILDFVPNHVAREYHSDARPKGVHDLGAKDDTTCAFSPTNNFYYIPDEPLHTEAISTAYPGRYKEYPARATGNDQFTAWPNANDWYETVKLNYGVDYCGGRTKYFPTLDELPHIPDELLPDTWRKMTDILLFWAQKGVDGFRCDMAEMVPVEFWAYAIKRVKRHYPNVCFIAEVYNPAEYRNYIHGGEFDFLYDKVGLYDTLRAVIRGEMFASEITRCWQSVDDIRSHMLNFLENHDEQRIASHFFAGNARSALPALVGSASMGTAPFMVYAGQEIGERGEDAEGFSGADGRSTIFDYWSVESLRKLLHGELQLKAEEKALYRYYQRIVQLQNENPALLRGGFFDLMYVNTGGEGLLDPRWHYAFLRSSAEETLLIVANFNAMPQQVQVRIPAHAFDVLNLPEGTAIFTDLLGQNVFTAQMERDCYVDMLLPGHGAVMLSCQWKKILDTKKQ